MCVAGIGLLALWPLLFTRQALYWGDIELYFAPMQAFFHRSLARGIVPLWNPYLLCGEPFVGNPQTWPLYPSSLLAGATDAWQFLTVSDGLHLVLGGLLFYGFLRGERLSRRPGCVLGAVCFMLGGYFVTKIQFPNMAQAIAWTPGILWAAGRLARAPGFRSAVLLGAALGLQLLAAHAQITLLTGYLALAYALHAAWPRLTRRGLRASDLPAARQWAQLAGWGATALTLACCLDAGQLLPTLEVWRHSDRQVLTLGTANRFVLGRWGFSGLVLPDLFGSPYTGDFHRAGNYWETACYLGIVPFALAAAEVWNGVKRRLRDTLFFFTVLILSLLLAAGRPGIYEIAFYLVPGVKAFHDPARMLLGAAVAGAALAGRGLDWALDSLSRRGAPWQAAAAAMLIGLTAADLARFDHRAYPLMPAAALEAAARSSQPYAAEQAGAEGRTLYPPDNKATWRYFVDYRDFRRADAGYVPDLLATRTTDTGMLVGMPDAGGYEPEPPLGAVRRYVDAYNAHTAGRGDAALDALGVYSLIAFSAGSGKAATGYFASHRMSVWRNPDRLTISPARLASGGNRYRYLRVLEPSPDEVVIAVPPGPSGETAQVADTDAPGWHASLSVPGAPGTALVVGRAQNGLQQVTLPRRETTGALTLRYRPSAWRVGVYLSFLAAAFVIAWATYAVLSRLPAAEARAIDSSH